MKKKKLLGINFLCGAVSILAFLVLWNIAVQGELGKMLPGPIPVLENFLHLWSVERSVKTPWWSTPSTACSVLWRGMLWALWWA